jgi:hypothetical protein
VREAEQTVGLAAHGAHDDHDVVARALRGEAAASDVPDAVDRPDRSTAELLDEKRHGPALYASLEEKKGFVVRPSPWFFKGPWFFRGLGFASTQELGFAST